MFRKHPDALALLVVGLFFLAANAPRMIIDSAPRWRVKPLGIQLPHEEIRVERNRIRQEIKDQVEAHREAVKSAIEEARSEVRSAIRGR